MNTETKFTPGPWTVGENIGGTFYNGCNVYTASNLGVCQVYGLPLHQTRDEIEADKCERWLEPLANARLIAAAPELLESLQVTEQLAIELMERAEKIDRMLAEQSGTERECELGQIARMRAQLSRNRAAIAKATEVQNG